MWPSARCWVGTTLSQKVANGLACLGGFAGTRELMEAFVVAGGGIGSPFESVFWGCGNTVGFSAGRR